MNEIINSHNLAGPIIVTIIYFFVWYYFLFVVQSKTKFGLIAKYKKAGKVFDRYFGQDKEMLAADRLIINTQEQMMPFLFSFWLYALFVSPITATWLGGAYIVLRIGYSFLLGKKISNTQPKKVYFVTFPGYFIIFFMLGSVLWVAVQ